MKCWEFRKCGRELGGSRAHDLGVCPAWPDGGHNCAQVTGTLCDGTVQGTYAQKIGSCRECLFYQGQHYRHEDISA